MTATTNAARGRANRRKGHDAERSVARYLQTVGFGGAQRAVRNTWPDPLDLTGIPGIVWSIKNVSATPTVGAWLAEAETVRDHQGAELAILVIRRHGKAQPARWWAWITYSSLARAVTGHRCVAGVATPTCFELGDLVPLLHAAGYGTPVDCEPTAEANT